jgi:hypothetical protein
MLIPPMAVCLERVRSRTGHGFTDRAAAEHMWHEFQRADVDPRHMVADPETGPAEITHTLADWVKTGTMRYP